MAVEILIRATAASNPKSGAINSSRVKRHCAYKMGFTFSSAWTNSSF